MVSDWTESIETGSSTQLQIEIYIVKYTITGVNNHYRRTELPINPICFVCEMCCNSLLVGASVSLADLLLGEGSQTSVQTFNSVTQTKLNMPKTHGMLCPSLCVPLKKKTIPASIIYANLPALPSLLCWVIAAATIVLRVFGSRALFAFVRLFLSRKHLKNHSRWADASHLSSRLFY